MTEIKCLKCGNKEFERYADEVDTGVKDLVIEAFGWICVRCKERVNDMKSQGILENEYQEEQNND